MGGDTKPIRTVGGRPMLHRVLAAVTDAEPRVVVGPPGLPVPVGAYRTQETPAGSGPVAGLAAGLGRLPARTRWVAVVAADLPFLTPEAVASLRRAARTGGHDGALYVDHDGRPQWLCGVWRVAALRDRLRELPAGPAGVALRALFEPVRFHRLAVLGPVAPPWYDCDTETQLRRAEEWHERAGAVDGGGG